MVLIVYIEGDFFRSGFHSYRFRDFQPGYVPPLYLVTGLDNNTVY